MASIANVIAWRPAEVGDGMDRRVIALLSAGHFIVDLYSGALPMLLFLLRPTLHLTYVLVGVASLLYTLTSSVVQPLFGYLSDKRQIAVLLPLGCLLSATGMSAAALGHPYPVLLALVIVAGCGSAFFHPEAGKTTAYYSGRRRGSGMALFSVGGGFGFALGPGYLLLLHDHLHGAAPYVMVLCGLAMTMVLARACGPLGRGVAARAARSAPSEVAWGVIGLILGIVLLRAWVQMGLVYFLPYWAARTPGGPGAGTLVTAYLLAGAVGTMVGGPLGDRHGRRTVLLGSLAPLTPLLLLFLALHGVAAAVVLVCCGALTVSTFSVTVVMTQELMARYQGMAAGLSTGFAIGMGGLGALLVGVLADHFGLPTAFLLLALLPLPAFGLTLLLPRVPSTSAP